MFAPVCLRLVRIPLELVAHGPTVRLCGADSNRLARRERVGRLGIGARSMPRFRWEGRSYGGDQFGVGLGRGRIVGLAARVPVVLVQAVERDESGLGRVRR